MTSNEQVRLLFEFMTRHFKTPEDKPKIVRFLSTLTELNSSDRAYCAGAIDRREKFLPERNASPGEPVPISHRHITRRVASQQVRLVLEYMETHFQAPADKPKITRFLGKVEMTPSERAYCTGAIDRRESFLLRALEHSDPDTTAKAINRAFESSQENVKDEDTRRLIAESLLTALVLSTEREDA
jgi:hypothetical protein